MNNNSNNENLGELVCSKEMCFVYVDNSKLY